MNSQNTDIHAAIAAANEKFMSAFAEGDAGGVAAQYTEGGQVLPPGTHIITGREGVEAFWRSAMELGIKRAELNTLELDQQADTAIEVGRARLYSEAGEVIDEPKYLVVWKRDRGQWKLHRDIWNSDAAPKQQ